MIYVLEWGTFRPTQFFIERSFIISVKKSVSICWFVLLILPLAVLLLSVVRDGSFSIDILTSSAVQSMSFAPFYNMLVELLDVFDIVPTGYLQFALYYCSWLLLLLLVNLVFKMFSFFLTCVTDRGRL